MRDFPPVLKAVLRNIQTDPVTFENQACERFLCAKMILWKNGSTAFKGKGVRDYPIFDGGMVHVLKMGV